MSGHPPPPTTTAPPPQLKTKSIGKSHVRVRKALARVDQSLGKIALAYGLQYGAVDAVAHSFLRLGQAVEWFLRREERYLQSLVREEHDSSRQPTCDGDEAEQQAAEIEKITTELRFLRDVTNNFVVPSDTCRSYRTLMKQLEELVSDLDVFINETTNPKGHPNCGSPPNAWWH